MRTTKVRKIGTFIHKIKSAIISESSLNELKISHNAQYMKNIDMYVYYTVAQKKFFLAQKAVLRCIFRAESDGILRILFHCQK